MSTIAPNPQLLAVAAAGVMLLAGCAVTADCHAPTPKLPAAWTHDESTNTTAQAAINAAW